MSFNVVQSWVSEAVKWVGLSIEVAGIGVIVVGIIWAIFRFGKERLNHESERVVQMRRRLGRAILLGLEFLVAADILRTVSFEPTLRQALTLGLIVLIRTFLSFSLEVETTGDLPWRKCEKTPDKARPEAAHG